MTKEKIPKTNLKVTPLNTTNIVLPVTETSTTSSQKERFGDATRTRAEYTTRPTGSASGDANTLMLPMLLKKTKRHMNKE